LPRITWPDSPAQAPQIRPYSRARDVSPAAPAGLRGVVKQCLPGDTRADSRARGKVWISDDSLNVYILKPLDATQFMSLNAILTISKGLWKPP
jgi:hypothetical protein